MKKPYLLWSSLLLLFSLILSSKAFKLPGMEAYSQEIPGTDVSFDMTPIPAGDFFMGRNPAEKGQEDELPRRKVELDAFWMGTHEVTWDLFEMFLDKDYEAAISQGPLGAEVDGVSRPSTPYLDMTFGMGKKDKPALAMTQYGAIQFCKWLYAKTGVFYRLPTEAEWEYAARAGSETAYFFGEDISLLDDYAWHAGNSKEKTQVVGQKKPNPWGLYDILGNVMEWTYDGYAPYSTASESLKNPVNVSEKLYPKVLRGGHYESGPEELRSAKRFASDPVWKQLDPQIPKSQWWFPEAPFVGLRLVRPVETPSEAEIQAYYDKAPIADY